METFPSDPAGKGSVVKNQPYPAEGSSKFQSSEFSGRGMESIYENDNFIQGQRAGGCDPHGGRQEGVATVRAATVGRGVQRRTMMSLRVFEKQSPVERGDTCTWCQCRCCFAKCARNDMWAEVNALRI